MKPYTQKQLEVMRDLHQVSRDGFKGFSVRRSERKFYARLEKDGLVYFLHHGQGRDLSIRLTEAGKQWIGEHFAYRYEDRPQRGQITWQDRTGKVTLVG